MLRRYKIDAYIKNGDQTEYLLSAICELIEKQNNRKDVVIHQAKSNRDLNNTIIVSDNADFEKKSSLWIYKTEYDQTSKPIATLSIDNYHELKKIELSDPKFSEKVINLVNDNTKQYEKMFIWKLNERGFPELSQLLSKKLKYSGFSVSGSQAYKHPSSLLSILIENKAIMRAWVTNITLYYNSEIIEQKNFPLYIHPSVIINEANKMIRNSIF